MMSATRRAALKYHTLKSNQEDIEHILDQSYLLLMLGRAVEMKPELKLDQDLMRYCNSIEAELNALRKVDFQSEKAAFLKFLSEVKVEAKAIGFDPEYKTQIDVELNGDSYALNAGWITQLLASK